MTLRNNLKQETLVYIVLWTALFMAPIFSFYIQNNESDVTYPWHELFEVWAQFLLSLVAFLIHNFILAPLLVHKQRYLHYFGSVAVLVSIFALIQCVHRPQVPHGTPFEHAQKGQPPHGFPEDRAHEWPKPIDGEEGAPAIDRELQSHPHAPKHEFHPPLFFSEHDLIATIMLFMMLGMNLGVKFFFRQREDQRRMAQLEKENLEQQLEHLKYQINPHFLMNTLNNIHALVDIDQEKAKEAVLELSKIMRFVLYEGAKPTVQLRHEIEFVENYIRLMRLRYSSKVDIQVDIPTEIPDCQVPPLLLISFIENAFKHGVSYRQESFIHIKVQADTKLYFDCKNSKKPQSEDEHGGVGLQNVKRRLKLIYGKNYVLNINDGAETYGIHLVIPL